MSSETEILSFDDALNKHKRLLTESLVNFDEGQRVRKIMLDIDSNSADYEYYFQSGHQSKQDEIDELQRKLDYSERLRSNQFEHLKEITAQRDMAQRVNCELQKRINDALDYVFGLYCTGDLDTERLENILKGESNE